MNLPPRKRIRLNAVILTNLKVKSINDLALNTITSNNLGVDAIMLGNVYVYDKAHNEIIVPIFARKE